MPVDEAVIMATLPFIFYNEINKRFVLIWFAISEQNFFPTQNMKFIKKIV